MKFQKKSISITQYLSLISEIRNKLHDLVASAERFLNILSSDDQTDLRVVTAIYAHALEEYGKLVLLGSLNTTNQTVDLSSIEFNYFDHDEKIKKALDDLAPEASVVRNGPFDPTIFDSGVFDTGINISWNLRLIILNTDIDKNGNVAKAPPVDKSDLQEAIVTLKRGSHY